MIDRLRISRIFLVSALAGVSLLGCGPVDAEGAVESVEETGSVELSLKAVPSEVTSIEVTVTGSRTVKKGFDVTPGSSPTLSFDGLPVGLVKVEAQAFSTSYSQVNASSVPLFVSEKAETVRIDPLDVAKVLLKLISNGRLKADVDFEAPPWLSTGGATFDFAVVGDTPYGAQQIEDLPNLLAAVDADESIQYLLHVGDIKEGSARCDDSYFDYIAASFSTLTIPLIFTPGDNEWTDCHRRNNGAYDPLERLAKLRELFYPVPGLALGGGFKQVFAQSEVEGYEKFVENQLWFESKVAFSTIHVVGSADSTPPWYTDDNTGTKVDDPARRNAERVERQAATLAWLDETFAVAAEQNAVGVVIFQQADMFDGSLRPTQGFPEIAQRIATLSKAFGKPVLLIEGDSHVYKADKPFATSAVAAPNLTRIVVQGSTTTPLTEWLKVHVDPERAEVFSWERKPR